MVVKWLNKHQKHSIIEWLCWQRRRDW